MYFSNINNLNSNLDLNRCNVPFLLVSWPFLEVTLNLHRLEQDSLSIIALEHVFYFNPVNHNIRIVKLTTRLFGTKYLYFTRMTDMYRRWPCGCFIEMSRPLLKRESCDFLVFPRSVHRLRCQSWANNNKHIGLISLPEECY